MISKNYICERCKDLAVIVHHKIELTPTNINDPAITLSHDNLEALCRTCHNKQHRHKGQTGSQTQTQPRYTFTATGEIEYSPP